MTEQSRIIRTSKRKEVVTFSLCWKWKDDPGAGYGFDCDEAGNVIPGDNPTALANLEMCRKNEGGLLEGPEIERRVHRYTEPAQVKCDCGVIVDLCHDPQTCHKCGADYNLSGQRLAPRRFWGEETGEHF